MMIPLAGALQGTSARSVAASHQSAIDPRDYLAGADSWRAGISAWDARRKMVRDYRRARVRFSWLVWGSSD